MTICVIEDSIADRWQKLCSTAEEKYL